MSRLELRTALAIAVMAGVGTSVFVVGGVGAQGSYTPVPSNVAVTNTVTTHLDSQSVAAITAPTCTLGTPYRSASLGTTPMALPTSVLSSRTRVVVTSLETQGVKEIWCCVNCTPSASQASALLPGMSKDYSARAVDLVNCRCSTATCSVNVEEYTCTQ